jgi:hypothetical protein
MRSRGCVCSARLISDVEAKMDLDALAAVHQREEHERSRLRELLRGLLSGEV